MKLKCVVCNKEFESSRSDARFDSSTCRSKYSRHPELYATNKKKKTNPEEITTPSVAESQVESVASFTPNWKRNGYRNSNDALLKAIGDVLARVPDTTLIMGNHVFTNVKESKVVISKAKYCPKHNKIQMGKKYACGCDL